MSTSQPIDSDLVKSLSEQSDQELIGILENPADWRPEVVEFARSELGRRSLSIENIDQTLAEKSKQRAEELQKRADVPLTFWESVFTALYGAGLGLLGALFVYFQVSRFKAEGYTLKCTRSWRLYWFAFGARIVGIILLVIFGIALSH